MVAVGKSIFFHLTRASECQGAKHRLLVSPLAPLYKWLWRWEGNRFCVSVMHTPDRGIRQKLLCVDVLGHSVTTLKSLGSDPTNSDLLLDIKPHLAEGGHRFHVFLGEQ